MNPEPMRVLRFLATMWGTKRIPESPTQKLSCLETITMAFGGILYYNDNKKPQISLANYLGPYLRGGTWWPKTGSQGSRG